MALARRANLAAHERAAAAAAASTPPLLAELLTETSWQRLLAAEFKRESFAELQRVLHAEWRGSRPVYPPAGDLFRALNTCAFDRVKAVVLGQASFDRLCVNACSFPLLSAPTPLPFAPLTQPAHFIAVRTPIRPRPRPRPLETKR